MYFPVFSKKINEFSQISSENRRFVLRNSHVILDAFSTFFCIENDLEITLFQELDNKLRS